MCAKFKLGWIVKCVSSPPPPLPPPFSLFPPASPSPRMWFTVGPLVLLLFTRSSCISLYCVIYFTPSVSCRMNSMLWRSRFPTASVWSVEGSSCEECCTRSGWCCDPGERGGCRGLTAQTLLWLWKYKTHTISVKFPWSLCEIPTLFNSYNSVVEFWSLIGRKVFISLKREEKMEADAATSV